MFAPQLDLFPYQDDAARFLANKDRAGLHDEMGVGKTATVIRAMEYIDAKRGMIIVPAMLRENWISEYRKFTRVDLSLCKGTTIHDYVAWKRGRYNVLVTSYEQATAWAKEFRAHGEILDFIAMDEAHYLKNSKTKRSKALLGPKSDCVDGLAEYGVHVWHVTGTPMANDPLDAYTFLAMCQCVSGLSETQFIRQFFEVHRGAYGSRHTVKPDMVPVMRQLLGNNAIRRTQDDVGLQLPPIFLTSAMVDGDDAKIVELLRQRPGLDHAITKALEQGGLSFLDAQYISTLRRLIGEAKAIPYGEMLLEELYGGKDKQVVYGFHKEALLILHEYLTAHGIKASVINGDTNDKARNAYVKSFQETDEHRVFIANIRAAGVGVTLTRSPYIDMLESDWTPAGNAQAIKRIHRIGQRQTCHARFIGLAQSFDQTVTRIVAQKTAAIAAVEGQAMNAAPAEELAQFL